MLAAVFASLLSTAVGAESFKKYEKLAERCRTKPLGLSILHSAGFRPAICLAGDLEQADLSEGIQRIEKKIGGRNARPILIVSSGGGDLGAAISIAEALGDYDVVVREKCLSACAGPLFLAAREKVILRDSEVGWHGGNFRTRGEFEEFWIQERNRYLAAFGDRVSEEDLKEQIWRDVSRLIDRESRLLDAENSKAIEVEHWYSKAMDCVPPVVKHLDLSLFWRPSLSELEEIFGVEFVSAESAEDYSYPMIFTSDESLLRWRLDSACVYKDGP